MTATAVRPAPARAAEVTCRRLGFRYPGGEHPALDRVDLHVPSGRSLALVGPSGCGKSTLLRVIAGLLVPGEGQLLLDGADAAGVRPERRDVGWVPQSYALFDHLDVAGNVAFGLRARRVRGPGAARRVGEVLELCRIGELARRPVTELSGGQRQRVAIARALAVSPRVLLLDEPLAALDPQLRTELRGELAALLRDSGVTTLLVTHDQGEALALADLVAVLRAGRVEQVDPPATVYEAPASAFVAEFVAGCRVLRDRPVVDGRAELAPGLAGPLRPGAAGDPVHGAPVDVALVDGTPVDVALRPTDLHLDPAGAPLRVRTVEYRGDRWRVDGELAGGGAVVLDSDRPVAAGTTVAVAVRPGVRLTTVPR